MTPMDTGRSGKANTKRQLRSRRGCTRCRQLGLKCDETRPSCQQCLKRASQCPGYQQEFRWSKRHEVFRSNPDAETILAQNSQSSGQQQHRKQVPQSTIPFSLGCSRPTIETNTLPAEHFSWFQELGSASTLTFHPALSNETPTSQAQNYPIPATRYTGKGTPKRVWDSNNNNDHNRRDRPAPKVVSECRHAAVQAGSTSIPDSGDTISGDDSPLSVGDPAPHEPCPPEQVSSREIYNDPEALLDYYFGKICDIHATFDDPTAPFRSVVGRRVRSSSLIFNCIVSMCATHMFQGVKAMVPLCLEYHSNAVVSLSEVITALDRQMSAVESVGLSTASETSLQDRLKEALLASILLGTSSSWLEPSDVGILHLQGARKLTEFWLRVLDFSSHKISPLQAMVDPEVSFIIGAMAYWEAVVAFIVDQPLNSVDYLLVFLTNPSQLVPNPFTGVTTPIMILLAQVGICFRQRRMLTLLKGMGWERLELYHSTRAEILTRVASLEEKAIDYVFPQPTAVLGIESRPDSFQQMLRFGQMYKLAVLLELYRSFPELLEGHGRESQFPDTSTPISVLLTPGTPQGTSASIHSVEQRKRRERRVHQLARNIVSLVEDTPLKHVDTSSIYQTLAFIISASALYPPVEDSQPRKPHTTSTDALGEQLASIEMRQTAVERWRSVLRPRMKTNTTCFGLSRLFERAEMLAAVIWSKLDRRTGQGTASNMGHGDSPLDTHWIDVMVEHNLQSFLG